MYQLSEVKLDHLHLLSDDVGIIQHASYGIPDRHYGYSADDVGRALVVLCYLYQVEKREDLLQRITTYLSFLRHAQTPTGHFHNFMSYDRRFLDEQGSEDTLGRVLWGLGSVVRCAPMPGMLALAQNMVDRSQGLMEELRAPRAKAYAICGLYDVLGRFDGASHCRRTIYRFARELVALYEANREDGWEWFEDVLTYGNAKISESLLRAYEVTSEPDFREVGLKTLEFLVKVQWNGDYFDLVGNQGWFPKNGRKATFGQQPIDAGYLVEACCRAYEITGEKKYRAWARSAFEWFLGRNRLGVPLYDLATGAVADGLDPQGASAHKGAESVICFLLALLSLLRVTSKERVEGRTLRRDGEQVG